MLPNRSLATGSVSSFPAAVATREYVETNAGDDMAAHHDGGDVVRFSAEESEEARPLHPDAKRLFDACGGRLSFLRYVPLFGHAIEAFGYKFILALDVTEFLSKGIANYSLQYSYYPMFCTRFGASAMAYQRYQNVAMMGWSIKPLTALFSDAFAVFGYTKRWYMVVSALAGTVCCFVYALLPGTPASAPIAAALLFLAGYCQANLDILSEGFYSRLMRRVPLAGPALVSTVWWMLSIGNIVASFIEGPLSDDGKERLGGYIAGACMAATVPFFAFNLYGEQTNRVERQADFLILLEQEKQRIRAEEAAAAAAAAGEGESHDEEDDDLASHLESRAAAKNAELLVAADAIAASRELPTGLTGLGDYSQDMVGFSMDLANPHVQDSKHHQTAGGHAGKPSEPIAHSDSGSLAGAGDVPTSTTMADDVPPELMLVQAPRIRAFCGGAIEFNQEVIYRNWRVTVYASIMTAGVIALAVVTILPGTYPLLFTCIGVTVGVSAISFWALPLVVAKASLYAFMNMMLYVQITGPLNSFYLATPECLPDGPHFSYFFYNSISSVIGSVANMVGVTLFTYLFAKRSYRLTFILTTILEVIGSVFDLIMVKRWNVAIHIPDHVMYVCGDAIVYQVAYMLNWMPMVVLLSQLCPRGSEAIVYALLAGFSNMGSTMATEIGTLFMDFIWPVTTTPPSDCNFKNLPILIIVSHLCIPLLQIPLVFFLIPGARVCDELDNDGNVIGVKGNSDHGVVHNNNTHHAMQDNVTTNSDDILTPLDHDDANEHSQMRGVSMTSARRSATGTAFANFSLSTSVHASQSQHRHRYQPVTVVPADALEENDEDRPLPINAAVIGAAGASASAADPPLFELAHGSHTRAPRPLSRGHTTPETVTADATGAPQQARGTLHHSVGASADSQTGAASVTVARAGSASAKKAD